MTRDNGPGPAGAPDGPSPGGIKRGIAFALCLAVLVLALGFSLLSPGFSSWENKGVADYYISEGLPETGSSSMVNSIVWGFRAFDTLGEEIVLFTAAVGVFSIMAFGISEKGREREKIGR